MPHKTYYRVQYDSSPTIHDNNGFQAPAKYRTPLESWLNRETIERHLERWSVERSQLTPFISVFDNWGE